MGGVTAIYILDSKGKPIIQRDYRGNVPHKAIEKFAQYIQYPEHLIKPVLAIDGINYVWIRHYDVYLLGITFTNTNVMMMLFFLYKLANVLQSYFKNLQEESIRDNFVVTYELLDEMMDDGFPQLTDEKILRKYIKNEAHQLLIKRNTNTRPPACVTNTVSWRVDNIVHKKNEIYLDVIERLNMIASANGNVVRSEILGSLRVRSYLSGMPELKLGLNDKLQLELANLTRNAKLTRAVELEDVRFHQCVRLAKFDLDRTISFIPPDGEFELMSYRLSTQVKPLIWVDCVISRQGKSRINYTIKTHSEFRNRNVAINVEIAVPVVPNVDTPVFQTATGTVKYVPVQNIIVWVIKQFPGQQEFVMTASFGLPSIDYEEATSGKRPISVQFEIPYFIISSLNVRYLRVVEKSGYHASPWVRYITRNGDYQIRMSGSIY